MNPPSALHGAMSRERKPFTYTPGGLDLSEIKSERMAKRLMRNAMNQGIPELPPQVLNSPPTPSTPIAVPNYNCLPVQVFPTFNLPANPKSLLRTRSTPDPQREPKLQQPFTQTQISINQPSTIPHTSAESHIFNNQSSFVSKIPQPTHNRPSGIENLRDTLTSNTSSQDSKISNNNRPLTFSEYSAGYSKTEQTYETDYGKKIYPSPVLPEKRYDAEICHTSQLKNRQDSTETNNIYIENEKPKTEVSEFTVKPLSDLTSSLVPLSKPVEDIARTSDDEQKEVKVVKKQVKKEKKVEIGNQNGEENGEAEMTVKLPAKKSAAKTETKVEVVKKVLPDGSIEEVKTTTTKTTIDGKTEIKTQTETTIIPKEEEQEEYEEVEEEEEEVEENGAAEVAQEQKQEVVSKSENHTPESQETVKIVKQEEKSETTTKKVIVVEESHKDEQNEKEDVKGEVVKSTITQQQEAPPKDEKVEQEEEEEVEEEEEEEVEEEEEEVEESTQEKASQKQQAEVVQVKETAAEPQSSVQANKKSEVEEEVEEEEEYEEAEEQEEAPTKNENKSSEIIQQKDEQKQHEETKQSEEKVEQEKEVHIKVSVEQESDVKNEELSKQDPKAEEPMKEEPQPTPTEKPRQPSIPLEKVEDVEIKPIGLVSKSQSESTEIKTSISDKPTGTLSTQTEYNRIENIVTVNRTTKTLDHSYEQITQQGIPTVKTYFAPERERVSTSPQPSRPYQVVYPPPLPTERRHSLLLERLSTERQMPSDIYQNSYQSSNQTYEQQRQWSQEPQAEVVNVSNVKPSTITNQQWYQQSRKENVLYNNVTQTPPAAAPQSWSQPSPQAQPQAPPQYQPQYQSPPQPQQQPQYQQYQPPYLEPTPTYQQNNYPSFSPKPSNWASSNLSSSVNSQTKQYSTESYQKSSQQYSTSYVPPPWEQDPSYVAPEIQYQPPPPTTNTLPTSTKPGWKPTPPAGKFSKHVPTSYIPPAPNQSFVKPVGTNAEPPKQPGRKTYYSEYERRYITVPESTYIPTEGKYQPQPDPSPHYYYDSNEPAESVEPQWRKELREFTEKTSQTQHTIEQTSVRPPWEEDPKYAKVPTVTYNPTPSWSQTLRPQSHRERSFESEFVEYKDQWSKTNTLGRSRPLSSYGNTNEVASTERQRGVSVDRYNPSCYKSPSATEHAPVQTHLHNPTAAAPQAKAYHNPNVPAYHARASAEPREQPVIPTPRNWGDQRTAPIQSRSFKYLQWITGTED